MPYPLDTDRLLEVVKYFTDQHKYPDLSCLVINKGSGKIGDGFHGDAKAMREKVHALDWVKVTLDHHGFSARTTEQIENKSLLKQTTRI